MTPRALPDGGDPQALIEAAARHRKGRGPAPAPEVAPEPPGSRRVRKAEKAPRAGDEPAVDEPALEARKKRPAGRERGVSTDTVDAASAKPGRKPRTPRPVPVNTWWARLGAWGMAAAAAALAVMVLTVDGVHEVPGPMPVTSIRIGFLPGPQLPVSEVMRWVNEFPGHERLRQPNTWVLDQLADYLRGLPSIAAVQQIKLIHQPAGNGRAMHRIMEIDLGLRQPVMPTVLTSGERAWVDRDGRILPGILPGPAQHRPMLRGVEQVTPAVIAAALAMWLHLEPQLEAGMVTDIVLNEALDDRGTTGIVLYTRYHNRLVWGDPAEERYGVTAADKVRDLVRTIRCQGDMGRIAVINVRFAQPFYTVRQ